MLLSTTLPSSSYILVTGQIEKGSKYTLSRLPSITAGCFSTSISLLETYPIFFILLGSLIAYSEMIGTS